MRIAIVGASPIPFCRGGIENFMAGLYRAINDYTHHSAELIKIPVREDSVPAVLNAYIRMYRLNLDHFDLIITTKYPAWNVRHRNHIIYLGHRLRGLYDTYPIPPERDCLWKSSPLRFPGPWIRRIVHWLDNRAIRPETISHAFCTSQTIASRAEYFHPDLPPAVVYHSTVREDFYEKPGEHLFSVNRLDAPKRVDLMIRAFRQVQTDIPFLIAGTGPQMDFLKNLAGDDSRIRFLGDVSEEKLLELYARSIAVLYTPYQEDYGLITVEAMKSGKPVITTSDAGGPLEFVQTGVNGWIADPDPKSLAEAINSILHSDSKLEEMSRHARATVQHISWRNTVTEILKPYQYWPLRQRRESGEPRRVTMLVPYPVFPPRSGGQRRVAGIATELSKIYDVHILSLGRFNTPPENIELNSQLHEIRIPMAPAHARKQWEFEKSIGETVSDAALPKLLPLTPNYMRALEHYADCSDIIICEQPYMFPHIPKSERIRLTVYSSQNFEYRLKAPILSQSASGRQLLADTRRAEAAAVRNSRVFFATSGPEGDDLCEFYRRDNTRYCVAANGVDTDAVQPVTEKVRARAREAMHVSDTQNVYLFVGAWHPPNLEALCFISQQLAPRFPDDLFLVVGSVSDHYRQQIGDPGALPDNMLLTGEVTETEKNRALAAADIALNPVISGSGTNLKILEYAAAGIPTLTTPVGIRGLALSADRDVMVAESDRFADALETLRDHPETRQRLAHAARATVVSQYDWKSIGRTMIQAMEAEIPPMGPLYLDMSKAAGFTTGWYAAETWDDAGDGPGTVRWTADTAECILASPGTPSSLILTVHAHTSGYPLTITDGIKPIFTGTLNKGWQVLELPVEPRYGADTVRLIFQTEAWSPADEGSADTRCLGIAVSGIKFR